MYHIALFTFHPDLLARKLDGLLAGDWRGVERVDTTASGAVASLRSVDGPSDVPAKVYDVSKGYWAVSQRRAGIEHPLPDHARYQYAAHNSLEELDTFLSELARRHLWAVISWGGALTDESFAFVTAEGWRLERFLAKAPNHTPLPWYSAGGASFRIVETDLLLARHVVVRSLLDKSTVALTTEADGGYFWDACVGDGEAVWLACPPPDRQGPDGRTLALWADAGELEAVGPVLEDAEQPGDGSWLYRVSRRDVFTRLAAWSRPANGAATQALSAELPCDRAVELLREYLADRNPQVVARVARVISRAPWFYTAGECHAESAYSRFATRRSELLARYVSATHAGGFELVSLF
jgi:hypothetical protein